ncbi:MAG: hypothetical protein MUE33_02490 [Cytophagaceae bacterium]|jgi:hypothetical protein|nr:hypothetical protein [Cytophagaceae bacterium]
MFFTEVKIQNDTEVRFSIERMVVVLMDANQQDLADKLQRHYCIVTESMRRAESAQSNHEYQLHLLTAFRESKGLYSLVVFLHTYGVIPIIEEDIVFLKEFSERIDYVRRSTKKNRINY